MNNLIIGIAGGSGSGKTTLAYRLKERFGEDEVRLISHDSYYKRHDEDGGRLNMLHLVAAVVVGVIVHGAVNGAARLQLLQVLDEQVFVERVRVVIVHLAAARPVHRHVKQ